MDAPSRETLEPPTLPIGRKRREGAGGLFVARSLGRRGVFPLFPRLLGLLIKKGRSAFRFRVSESCYLPAADRCYFLPFSNRPVQRARACLLPAPL